MGRFVTKVSGDLNFEWKYGFAEQCSNFGIIALNLKSYDVSVETYSGESGEFVTLKGSKTDIIKAIDNELKNFNGCPLCNQSKCGKWTLTMLKYLKNRIEKHKSREINVILFSEY